MDTKSDDYVREAAYYIWEQEGRPHGMDFEHWVKAKAELGRAAKSQSRKGQKKKSCASSAKSSKSTGGKKKRSRARKAKK